MRLGEYGGDCERKAGGELLYCAAHNRMRLGLMTSLQDGAERPAGTPQLQQQEAAQQWTTEALVHGIGRHQQNGACEADKHTGNGGPMQSNTAWDERFDAPIIQKATR